MIRWFFLCFVLLNSCQKAHFCSLPQKARVNIVSDPQTLDPRKARDLTTVTLMHMLYEGLFRISKTGELEYALVRDVKVSEDKKQYTFILKDSRWSNKDPVTSFDFIESWRSILDPDFPTDLAYQLYVIKNGKKAKMGEVGLDQIGICAPDPYTLIVDLEQPIPYFPRLLAMSTFMPIPSKIARLNSNWSYDPKTCICNGPFKMESWKHSDLIDLVKNPYYWEANEVCLDKIELLMLDAETEMFLFEQHKLDWAGSPLSSIPTDAIDNLKKSQNLQIVPFSATYFFRVNTSDMLGNRKNPLSSTSLRKALAYAVDRRAIAEHVLQGGQTPARALVPPPMGLSERGYFFDNQNERGRLLVKKALLELGVEELDPLVISYSNSERNAQIAQAIQKQWEERLKIKVELEAIEPKTFYHRISNREFQLAAGSWTADFDDPINFLEVFKYRNSSTNNTNWENVKYIDLLDRSALCKDLEEREKILKEAEQILMEQMPIIPVFHYALNYLQSEDLKDVSLSQLGKIDFRWAQKIKQ